jgi:DNA-binding transcriptional LysR family regulator
MGPDGEAAELPFQPTLDSDDWLILKQAALAGLGIVAMPEDICAPEIAEGKLETVLAGWALPSATLHIVYASRRGLVPAVRSFVDFVAERLPLLRNAGLR